MGQQNIEEAIDAAIAEAEKLKATEELLQAVADEFKGTKEFKDYEIDGPGPKREHRVRFTRKRGIITGYEFRCLTLLAQKYGLLWQQKEVGIMEIFTL